MTQCSYHAVMFVRGTVLLAVLASLVLYSYLLHDLTPSKEPSGASDPLENYANISLEVVPEPGKFDWEFCAIQRCSGHGNCTIIGSGDDENSTQASAIGCECDRWFFGPQCQFSCPNFCSYRGDCVVDETVLLPDSLQSRSQASSRKRNTSKKNVDQCFDSFALDEPVDFIFDLGASNKPSQSNSTTNTPPRAPTLPLNISAFEHAVCSCQAGYAGSDCSKECKKLCSGHGTCREARMISLDRNSSEVEPVCECFEGYTGEDCSVSCPNQCSQHGQCVEIREGVGACDCDRGFEGRDCSQAVRRCCLRQFDRSGEDGVIELDANMVKGCSADSEFEWFVLPGRGQLLFEVEFEGQAYGGLKSWNSPRAVVLDSYPKNSTSERDPVPADTCSCESTSIPGNNIDGPFLERALTGNGMLYVHLSLKGIMSFQNFRLKYQVVANPFNCSADLEHQYCDVDEEAPECKLLQSSSDHYFPHYSQYPDYYNYDNGNDDPGEEGKGQAMDFVPLVRPSESRRVCLPVDQGGNEGVCASAECFCSCRRWVIPPQVAMEFRPSRLPVQMDPSMLIPNFEAIDDWEIREPKINRVEFSLLFAILEHSAEHVFNFGTILLSCLTTLYLVALGGHCRRFLKQGPYQPPGTSKTSCWVLYRNRQNCLSLIYSDEDIMTHMGRVGTLSASLFSTLTYSAVIFDGVNTIGQMIWSILFSLLLIKPFIWSLKLSLRIGIRQSDNVDKSEASPGEGPLSGNDESCQALKMEGIMVSFESVAAVEDIMSQSSSQGEKIGQDSGANVPLTERAEHTSSTRDVAQGSSANNHASQEPLSSTKDSRAILRQELFIHIACGILILWCIPYCWYFSLHFGPARTREWVFRWFWTSIVHELFWPFLIMVIVDYLKPRLQKKRA